MVTPGAVVRVQLRAGAGAAVRVPVVKIIPENQLVVGSPVNENF